MRPKDTPRPEYLTKIREMKLAIKRSPKKKKIEGPIPNSQH